MKLLLPNSIYSREDLTNLLREVHDYAQWYSHNSIKARVNSKQGVPPPVLSSAALEIIRNSATKGLLSEASLAGLIIALEKFQSTAPVMTMTLAAPASSELKHSLVDWCRKNIEPNILINFRFNGTLLGGMVVSYGSHVFDWSFRRQILAKRDLFPQVLRNV